MPLQTTPCSRGAVPVVSVAWAVQVTAGNGGLSETAYPCPASAFRFGVAARWSSVRQTRSSTRTCFVIGDSLTVDRIEVGQPFGLRLARARAGGMGVRGGEGFLRHGVQAGGVQGRQDQHRHADPIARATGAGRE